MARPASAPARRDWVLTALIACVTSLLGATVTLFLVAGLRGWQVQSVLTDSMSPAIRAGSLVITVAQEPANIEPGLAIAYKDPQGRMIVHRVLRVTYAGERVFYQTKGDGNPLPDGRLVAGEALVGRVRWSIPHLGGLLRAMRAPPGGVLLLGMPAVLLLRASLKLRESPVDPLERFGAEADILAVR